MIRLRLALAIISRKRCADRLFAPSIILFTNSLHAASNTAPMQDPLRRSRVQLNIIKKYRKLLQDLFQSGSFGEEVAFLQITNITPCERKGHFEVHCALPSPTCATAAESGVTSLALRLQHLANANSNEIRAKVTQNRIEYKQPTFHFIVSTDVEASCADSKSSTSCDPVTAEQSATPLSVLKPSNVYGLPRDELLKRVRVKAKERIHESVDQDSAVDERPTDTAANPRVKSEWAKLCKQREDWRLEARRERKRARQNVGLYRLTVGQDGVTILDMDAVEDEDEEDERS